MSLGADVVLLCTPYQLTGRSDSLSIADSQYALYCFIVKRPDYDNYPQKLCL